MPLDHGHVHVLQARSGDLQFGDLVAVFGVQLGDVAGGVGGAVDLALAADAPDDLAVLCHQLGEMVGAAVGDDPAPGQEEDPVGEFFGLGQVVGGEHDRGVLLVGEAEDQVVEVSARLGVEPGGGFVEEEQFGAADDADRNVQAAALSPGEGLDSLIRVLGEAHQCQELVGVVGACTVGAGVGRVEPPEVVDQVACLPGRVVAP